MDGDYLIQISIVALIILGAIVWIVVRLIRRSSGEKTGCECCEISPSCKKKGIKHPSPSSQCSEHPESRHDEQAAKS